jgi:hypothetical protein
LLNRIEEELGTTIYPGTEIMADVGTHHFVKSSAKSDRVLVPQPSQDPHDPLVSMQENQTIEVSPNESVKYRIGTVSGS